MNILRPLVKPDARSPYQRYGKTPSKYSDLYQRWNRLMKSGHEQEANAVGAEHTARFLGVDIIEDVAA